MSADELRALRVADPDRTGRGRDPAGLAAEDDLRCDLCAARGGVAGAAGGRQEQSRRSRRDRNRAHRPAR